MFKPVKLFRVTIQVPDKYMSLVLGILGDFKLLHLININETQLGKLGYVAGVEVDLLNRYERALERIGRLVRELDITGPVPPLEKAPRPDRDIFHIEERLSEIEDEVSSYIHQGRKAEKELSEKQDLIARLSLLEPAEIDFTRLDALKFVHCSFGILPAENLDRLEESLSDIHHSLVKIGGQKDKLVMAAFSLKKDKDVLERALRSAFFQELEFPPGLQGPVSQVIKDLKDELPSLEEKAAQAKAAKEEFRQKYSQVLLVMREQAYVAMILLRAQAKFGKIDHTYLLTGWLPVNLYDRLKDRIIKATEGQAVIDRVDPEDIREVREGIIKIPILFNNPLLIRPFEKLTSLYGTPSYQEVEPTVFLALSFVLLFGMMFGDVGHGLVLFLAGLYIFRRLYKYMDYGIILMECGVSSAVFGALYGSVFGLEDLIPALWLHPMKDINRFMMISAAIGIGMISLGLVLNLINIVKRRSWSELLSAGGLVGALLYWLLAGLAIRYVLSGPPLPVEITVAKAVSALLLFIMIIERPVRALVRRRKARKKGAKPGEQPGLGTMVLESTIEALDSVLRFLANTVSFVRVAAFALTHAAL
ncbi:MAG: hypothetical protein DSZ23_01495, partial [Thermodesulfatator sp.]